MDSQLVNEVTYADALAMLDGVVTSGIYKAYGKDWCCDRRSSALAHFRGMLISAKDGNTA